MSATQSDVVNSFTEFAVDFYGAWINENPATENVFFSPLSIYTAMTMTMVGAVGETRTEMRDALRIPQSISDEDLHQRICIELLEKVRANQDVEIALANRIFLCVNAKLQEGFTKTCKTMYHAEADLLTSLSRRAQATHINQWVNETTRGKIDSIISEESITDETVCFLVNALFFKGDWYEEFDKSHTENAPFIRLNGQTQDVPMMFLETKMPFADLREIDARALILPFKGVRWSLLVILPNEDNGLPNLLEEIRKPGMFKSILSTYFEHSNVKLWLPKLKLGQDTSIGADEILKLLGMKKLFERDGCELHNLCRNPSVFVDGVTHKAIFEADEKGATAAAVTVVNMCLTMSYRPPTPWINFRVDHPFFLALLCDQFIPTFMGHVTDIK